MAKQSQPANEAWRSFDYPTFTRDLTLLVGLVQGVAEEDWRASRDATQTRRRAGYSRYRARIEAGCNK